MMLDEVYAHEYIMEDVKASALEVCVRACDGCSCSIKLVTCRASQAKTHGVKNVWLIA
jgi:hypothetical protein